MDDLDSQLGELEFPFPAKILEKELFEAGIEFKYVQEESADFGTSWAVFFVKVDDLQHALKVKKTVEAESIKRDVNPKRAFEARFVLALIVIVILIAIYFLITA